MNNITFPYPIAIPSELPEFALRHCGSTVTAELVQQVAQEFFDFISSILEGKPNIGNS